MDTLFSVNGVTYKAKEFDFNLVCDLEEMGVSMADAETKPMSMIRAYFALCTGKGIEFAGNEMQAHMLNGGNFSAISDAMGKMMSESGFFRAISKTAETGATATAKKATKAKTAVAE